MVQEEARPSERQHLACSGLTGAHDEIRHPSASFLSGMLVLCL